MENRQQDQPRRSHVQEVRELYRDDPFLSHLWYGRMIEDAQARDDLEAESAEAEQGRSQ